VREEFETRTGILSQKWRDPSAERLKGSDFQYECNSGCRRMFTTKAALADHIRKRHLSTTLDTPTEEAAQ
jgi:hypothetical protein